MKTALLISLFLNAALLLLFSGVSFNGTKSLVHDSIPATIETKPAATNSIYSFHWSQLDSPHFPTFIANLRGIGCPEATIQDIIQSELTEIYGERRLALQANNQTSSAPSKQNSAELKKLDAEQSLVFKELFAPSQNSAPSKPDPSVASSNRSTNRSMAESETLPRPAALPLIYRNPNIVPAASTTVPTENVPGTLIATPEQLDTLKRLRNTFEQDLAGTSKDPQDPEYLKSWEKARVTNDELLRGALGWEAYNAMSLAAAKNADAAARAKKN